MDTIEHSPGPGTYNVINVTEFSQIREETLASSTGADPVGFRTP